MKPYRAIFFDLFDTVVVFYPERLPVVEVHGRFIRSTAGIVHSLVEREFPHVSFGVFYQALQQVNQEVMERRKADCREISVAERMGLVLARLGVGDRTMVQRLSTAHMEKLMEATACPAEHRQVLTSLHRRYPLGLISNFDHATTAYRILKHWGLDNYFQSIIISDHFGLRKPHPAIFLAALRALAVPPSEALFVGDSPHEDVAGAKRICVDAVWLNRDGEKFPPHLPAPDLVISRLAELPEVLEI